MELTQSGAKTADGMDFHFLADNVPVLIWLADTSKAGTFFNRTWLEFTGRTLEQERGFGWTEAVHADDLARCIKVYTSAFDARQDFTMEYRLRRHDGQWRRILDSGRPLREAATFIGYIGSCIDITEMRQALEDRETLLSELHHRVKNNAQATTSFLGLQANRASDPVVAAALRSAATRIMLATLVQDRMFRVSDDTGIDLGVELATTARAALDIAGRPQIRLEIRLEDRLVLPVSQATPLVLIVNELVVNAARHAFPDGSSGHVRVTVRRAGPHQGEVVVADDGVGLPDTLLRNTPQGSLGLHLMPRLARQARATLRLEANGGTCASLLFAAA